MDSRTNIAYVEIKREQQEEEESNISGVGPLPNFDLKIFLNMNTIKKDQASSVGFYY